MSPNLTSLPSSQASLGDGSHVRGLFGIRERHVPPEEFDELKVAARDLGFRHVESGPLVRSSYHAHGQLQ